MVRNMKCTIRDFSWIHVIFCRKIGWKCVRARTEDVEAKCRDRVSVLTMGIGRLKKCLLVKIVELAALTRIPHLQLAREL